MKWGMKSNSLQLNTCVAYNLLSFSRAIEDYMTEKVQFVVTSEGWHDSFEDVSWILSSLSFLVLLLFHSQPNNDV